VSAREGFITGYDGDEHPIEARHKPKIAYKAPEGPHLKEAEPEEPKPDKLPPGANSEPPPPLDLDAAPADIEWPVTLKLLYRPTRDIKNKVIHELTLRSPTAGDIGRCGNPVRINAAGDVIVDEAKMTQMLAVLSNVFPPMIETLDARDWASCAFFLQRFFLPNSATWMPTPSSTPTG
jgi:hypothetical protein